MRNSFINIRLEGTNPVEPFHRIPRPTPKPKIYFSDDDLENGWLEKQRTPRPSPAPKPKTWFFDDEDELLKEHRTPRPAPKPKLLLEGGLGKDHKLPKPPPKPPKIKAWCSHRRVDGQKSPKPAPKPRPSPQPK